jgi:hypothetical protein
VVKERREKRAEDSREAKPLCLGRLGPKKYN